MTSETQPTRKGEELDVEKLAEHLKLSLGLGIGFQRFISFLLAAQILHT
jgi:hypothetical protein